MGAREHTRAALLAVITAMGLLWAPVTQPPVAVPETGPVGEAGFPAPPAAGNAQPRHEAWPAGYVDHRAGESADPAPAESIVWGSVETSLGYVVEGEKVALYSPSINQRYASTSDGQGRFLINGVRAAGDYRVSVSPDGMFKSYERRGLEIDGGQTPLRVVLQPLRTGLLRGEIVNGQGRPVPDFDIALRSLSVNRGAVNARSDSVGLFQIDDFPEGPLEASARQRILRIDRLSFDPEAGELLTLVVDEGGNQLSGLVYDGYGQPRYGVIVLLTWEHARSDGRTVMERRTLTDAWGRFVLDGLGEGPHELVLATSEGDGLKRRVNIGEDPAELILYLE